jgi:hypothetical protein
VALTAWNRQLGATQGRISPAQYAPPEGSFAFVLGCDLPGLRHKLAVGDHVEVRQRASFGDSKLVRVRAHLRSPPRVPDSVTWEATLRIDGVEYACTRLLPGKVRDRADIAANVSKLAGEHELSFRLELVAA